MTPGESKKKRITCNMCRATMRNDFLSQWKHLVTFHPLEFLPVVANLVANSDTARLKGEQVARRVFGL